MIMMEQIESLGKSIAHAFQPERIILLDRMRMGAPMTIRM